MQLVSGLVSGRPGLPCSWWYYVAALPSDAVAGNLLSNLSGRRYTTVGGLGCYFTSSSGLPIGHTTSIYTKSRQKLLTVVIFAVLSWDRVHPKLD